MPRRERQREAHHMTRREQLLAALPNTFPGLMAALQYVDVPGYSALILRRTVGQIVEEGLALHHPDLTRAQRETRVVTMLEDADGEARGLEESGVVVDAGHGEERCHAVLVRRRATRARRSRRRGGRLPGPRHRSPAGGA